MLRYIRDYIFPSTCLSCSSLVIDNNKFCAKCWHHFDFIAKPYCEICGKRFEISSLAGFTCYKCLQSPPAYDKARSLLKFDSHSRIIIHAFKYNDKLEAATTFAHIIYNRYKDDIADVDLIAPVPMNRFKRLFRMYNQAEILAKEIANISGKNLCSDLLIKNRWTKSQTFLSKNARKKNVLGTITFNNKSDIKNKSVLLVDDVLTTGTTVGYCSLILKKAGAKMVIVVTIATT